MLPKLKLKLVDPTLPPQQVVRDGDLPEAHSIPPLPPRQSPLVPSKSNAMSRLERTMLVHELIFGREATNYVRESRKRELENLELNRDRAKEEAREWMKYYRKSISKTKTERTDPAPPKPSGLVLPSIGQRPTFKQLMGFSASQKERDADHEKSKVSGVVKQVELPSAVKLPPILQRQRKKPQARHTETLYASKEALRELKEAAVSYLQEWYRRLRQFRQLQAASVVNGVIQRAFVLHATDRSYSATTIQACCRAVIARTLVQFLPLQLQCTEAENSARATLNCSEAQEREVLYSQLSIDIELHQCILCEQRLRLNLEHDTDCLWRLIWTEQQMFIERVRLEHLAVHSADRMHLEITLGESAHHLQVEQSEDFLTLVNEARAQQLLLRDLLEQRRQFEQNKLDLEETESLQRTSHVKEASQVIWKTLCAVVEDECELVRQLSSEQEASDRLLLEHMNIDSRALAQQRCTSRIQEEEEKRRMENEKEQERTRLAVLAHQRDQVLFEESSARTAFLFSERSDRSELVRQMGHAREAARSLLEPLIIQCEEEEERARIEILRQSSEDRRALIETCESAAREMFEDSAFRQVAKEIAEFLNAEKLVQSRASILSEETDARLNWVSEFDAERSVFFQVSLGLQTRAVEATLEIARDTFEYNEGAERSSVELMEHSDREELYRYHSQECASLAQRFFDEARSASRSPSTTGGMTPEPGRSPRGQQEVKERQEKLREIAKRVVTAVAQAGEKGIPRAQLFRWYGQQSGIKDMELLRAELRTVQAVTVKLIEAKKIIEHPGDPPVLTFNGTVRMVPPS